MMPSPEQKKIIERCAAMLKRACGGLKRIIFDLAPDKETDTVHFEIHGKIKLANEDEPYRIIDMTDDKL